MKNDTFSRKSNLSEPGPKMLLPPRNSVPTQGILKWNAIVLINIELIWIIYLNTEKYINYYKHASLACAARLLTLRLHMRHISGD